MKIRNKKTGEVIDLSPTPSKASEDSFEKKSSETDARIKERGTIQDSAKKIVTEKSGVKKAVAGLEVASAPLNAVESGISNPMLQLQKGNANPADLMKEAILGLSLQKQGQYGDIMKNAGYNPLLADTGGLILNMSPIKVLNAAAKTFGNISKISDKALEKAGRNIIDAVHHAKNSVGTKVTQEFARGADNVQVDGFQFVNAVADLPAPVMNKAELAFGKLEDFANGLTVGKLREFTRFIGKLKPSSFGKSDRGLQEGIEVIDLNKVYGKTKTLLYDTLNSPNSGIDKKTVNHLVELENAFHEVADAGRFIKRTIVDPTIGKPTKVGNLAKKVVSSGDSTARVALSTVKKASAESMNRINGAMRKIESFNRNQKLGEIASHATKAAAYGGAAGIGSRILRHASEKDS